MAVLGKIRQRSIFLILVIGMALFAFVISGVFDGNSSNAGPTDPIGIINDDEVRATFLDEFGTDSRASTRRDDSFSAIQGGLKPFSDFFSRVWVSYSSPGIWHDRCFFRRER